MATIGSRIRSLRDYKGWSQEDLAKRSSLGRAHISLIENNERTPAADSLAKLATALETSTDFLLGLTDNPAPYPTDLPHPALADPRLRFIVDLWGTKVGDVDFVTEGYKQALYELIVFYQKERSDKLKRDVVL